MHNSEISMALQPLLFGFSSSKSFSVLEWYTKQTKCLAKLKHKHKNWLHVLSPFADKLLTTPRRAENSLRWGHKSNRNSGWNLKSKRWTSNTHLKKEALQLFSAERQDQNHFSKWSFKCNRKFKNKSNASRWAMFSDLKFSEYTLTRIWRLRRFRTARTRWLHIWSEANHFDKRSWENILKIKFTDSTDF